MMSPNDKPGLVASEAARDGTEPAEVRGPRAILRWFLHDSPYIAMLLLALGGVTFRSPVGYWMFLTPVFGIISVVAGWRHFQTREEHLQLIWTQAASWCALVLAIYVLYNNGMQGLLNTNASSLAMVTLLALGTFVAGVQARVWRTSAVGAILFLAVPGIGWLDQSAPLLVVVTLAIIAIGGFVWWVEQK